MNKTFIKRGFALILLIEFFVADLTFKTFEFGLICFGELVFFQKIFLEENLLKKLKLILGFFSGIFDEETTLLLVFFLVSLIFKDDFESPLFLNQLSCLLDID